MGDLDFTNMAIDNNIDHLRFRKISGSYEQSANSSCEGTELKPHALESQEAANWRIKKGHQVAPTTTAWGFHVSVFLPHNFKLLVLVHFNQTLNHCVQVSNVIHNCHGSDNILHTRHILCGQTDVELQMFNIAKRKKSNTPFMPRRSCDFSTILGVFFSSLVICMSTLFLAAAARAFIFTSKIGFVSAACTYRSYMKLRGNSL